MLGFGARAMSPEDKPKYLNTSESELFHKSQVVYGRNGSRGRGEGRARGPGRGLHGRHRAAPGRRPETVAQMGTALTDAQINAVARLAPRALFCQDPDRAGQESVAKGIRRRARQRAPGHARRRVPDRPAADRTGPGGRRPAVRRRGDARVARQGGARSSASRSSGRSTPDLSPDAILADDEPIIASLPENVLRQISSS